MSRNPTQQIPGARKFLIPIFTTDRNNKKTCLRFAACSRFGALEIFGSLRDYFGPFQNVKMRFRMSR